MNTQHKFDCRRAWRNYDSSCPRCQELMQGAAPRPGWRNCQVPARVAAVAFAAPVCAETVIVFKHNDSWVADFAATSEAQKITNLFGSTVLPTPFFGPARAEDVIAAVQSKNPRYKVLAR